MEMVGTMGILKNFSYVQLIVVQLFVQIMRPVYEQPKNTERRCTHDKKIKQNVL